MGAICWRTKSKTERRDVRSNGEILQKAANNRSPCKHMRHW
jgi:hypothetical protein